MQLTFALAAAAVALPAVRAFDLRGTKDGFDHKTGHSRLAEEPPNPDVFEPAISLKDFANVDPDQFAWVNPDEIGPGETTCGFLTAPLGWDVEGVSTVYPDVKVCEYSA